MRYFCFLIFFFILELNISFSQKTKEDIEITVTGIFKSMKGVMTDLSCYCFASGYITQNNGVSIPVCFDELGNLDVICNDELTVKGTFKVKKIVADKYNPCPSGEMEILYVKSYQCKDKNQKPRVTLTLEGSFRSVKGVKDNISCFFVNAGYLTNKNGKVIVVSFDELDPDVDVKCNYIILKGFYQVKQMPLGKGDCSGDRIKYFRVFSYECK